MKNEKCEFCNGFIESAIRRIPFHYRKKTIYVDHVPVRICASCGEVFFEAVVYKKLEQIAKSRDRIRTHLTFPLADYRTERVKA